MYPELPTPAPHTPSPTNKTWRDKLQKLKHWAKAHKSQLLFAGALTFIIGTGLVLWAMLYFYQNPQLSFSNGVPKPDPVYYSPLTGVKVKDEAATKQLVTALMMENSPDARPQSGIKESGVVYEAIAEGGITRFLLLYQESKPKLIGPVRSLRMYYLDWATPYDASIAHIGGSAKALKTVRNGSYKDIDQFFNAGAYWRVSDRYAPHNVYTDFKHLDKLNRSKGFTSSNFDSFPRGDGEPAKKPNATRINVSISSDTYNSSYRYNKKNNNYTRSQGGATHKDREKGSITPKVVIVIKVSMQTVMEDGYREQIKTSDTGQAYVFQNGTVQKGTWKKTSRKAQIQFLDKNGKQIELNRGQTWITALPKDRSVSWR
jgi:hypothetical protein